MTQPKSQVSALGIAPNTSEHCRPAVGDFNYADGDFTRLQDGRGVNGDNNGSERG